MNKTVNRLRGINSSLLFFFGNTALTLSLLTLAWVVIDKFDSRELFNFPKNFIVEFENIFNDIHPLFYYLEVILGAISIFTLISFWIFYVSNWSKIQQNAPVDGISLFRPMKILECIALTAALGYVIFLLVLSVIEYIGIGNYENSFTYFVGIGVTVAILVVFIILCLTYYKKLLRTVKAIEMTLKTGVIMGRISTFVPFMLYTFALIFMAAGVFTVSIPYMLSKFLMAISFICFAFYTNKVRKTLNNIADKGGSEI